MNDQPWWRGVDPGHRLTGKRAFVTGAGTAPGGDLLGIGEAIAVLFASQGARVAVADVSAESAAATVGLITDAGGKGVAVVGDLSSEADNARCVEEAVRALGGLDTAVNNVALPGGGGSPTTVDLDVWERVMAVNVRAAMLTAPAWNPSSQALWRGINHQHFVHRGHPRTGRGGLRGIEGGDSRSDA
jgi:NAD(P)-dependent dehydrogenase (short-subunit alcohol dehydrogenase family)